MVPGWLEAKLGWSAVQVGGVALLADVDGFTNLPLPTVLLLVSMCGNTIFQVLLHCVLVFLQSFLHIPASLPNVYMLAFITGNFVHHPFLYILLTAVLLSLGTVWACDLTWRQHVHPVVDILVQVSHLLLRCREDKESWVYRAVSAESSFPSSDSPCGILGFPVSVESSFPSSLNPPGGVSDNVHLTRSLGYIPIGVEHLQKVW